MSTTDGRSSVNGVQVERDATDTPVRVAYVQPHLTVKVTRPKERFVMSFPHLIVREVIAFEVLSIVVILMSLFLGAPLEEIASAVKTPNPAKAPWYFLGLQELLHYYPPIVSGVLIPALVVVALVAVPYVRININQAPLSVIPAGGVRLATAALVAAASLLWLVDAGAAETAPLLRRVAWAFPEAVALDLYIPTLLVWAVPFALTFARGESRLTAFLRSRGLPFWVMTWFTALATTLTVIGTLFRGQSWAFVLPWG